MRTPRQFYTGKATVYICELEQCPVCSEGLVVSYTSGRKTVQTLPGVLRIAQRPKHCGNPDCAARRVTRYSAEWQQLAPAWCTYGYDVIAQIGWQRQMAHQGFGEIHTALEARLQISETQVRMLYHQRYLPLLACHERQQRDRLQAVASHGGLILGLDGLAPEGGEPQLWLVRELHTGLTLRCGWMSQQDQSAFVHFLQPIADTGWPVLSVMSDKQRGLVPAVAEVFPQAKHAFCQIHYLNNAVAPLAEADEAMKVDLRQAVRAAVGPLIRQEQEEAPGVLTVTGVLPSPMEAPRPSQHSLATPEEVTHERERIVGDLGRRVRYLLTLKGRPPFRLAGLEMFDRLTEVRDCLTRLIALHPDPQLVNLQQGLSTALQTARAEYVPLRQAADWLDQIADCLAPDHKSARSGTEVQHELDLILAQADLASQENPQLHAFWETIQRTTDHYAPGLFYTYDVPGLPRTNNARESDFRDLNRRLLRTTGQKGLTRRLLQREGAWELLPHPFTLPETIQALSQVQPPDFYLERQRVIQHRDRFRLHSRSAKQSQAQLNRLEQRWAQLSNSSP